MTGMGMMMIVFAMYGDERETREPGALLGAEPASLFGVE
jgi:hypothetical protein